jgi:AbrB family looped-hinge helix DNA binding protein
MPGRIAQRTKHTVVSRIGQRRQVVIPKAVFDELRLRPGDFVEVTAQGGSVSLKPTRSNDVEDTLTSAEAKKLRLGLRQIKERKTRPWNEIKHELGL